MPGLRGPCSNKCRGRLLEVLRYALSVFSYFYYFITDVIKCCGLLSLSLSCLPVDGAD